MLDALTYRQPNRSLQPTAHRTTKPVLLAPAGSLVAAQAALDAGANAIYVGPRGWSRRRDTFEMDDGAVREVIALAHDGGAKLRVACNTHMQSIEIPALLSRMERFVMVGVDGAIMAAIGAIAAVHQHFPELPLHASIGANVFNDADAAFYREIGIRQVVADTKLTSSRAASTRAPLWGMSSGSIVSCLTPVPPTRRERRLI